MGRNSFFNPGRAMVGRIASMYVIARTGARDEVRCARGCEKAVFLPPRLLGPRLLGSRGHAPAGL